MIITDVSNINKRSSVYIDVICDDCNKEFNIKYINYTRNGNKDGYYTCKSCKTKKTNLKKWGVENPSQRKDIKEKKKKTYLENWGVDHPSKSDKVKKSKEQTNLKKLGVDNPFKSDIIKDKIKNTNLEKLGVDNPSKSKEIKDKKKKTTLQNWGVDHPLKSNIIIDKIKKGNLEKWGVEWVVLHDNIKEKIKNTNIEKWGVDNPMKSDIIKNKVISNNRQKWGVDHFYQSDEFKQSSDITKIQKYGNTSYKKSDLFYNSTIIGTDKNFIKYIGNSISLFRCEKGHTFEIKGDNYHSRFKYNIPLCTVCNPIGDSVSIKEKELYGYINSIYDGELIQSYRDGLEIDIYLPELKIGFEFNGLYWHSDKYKDKWYHINKSNYFKDKGIKIIHIWEDDWDFKNKIIKSQIRNWLGLNSEKVFARKCEFKELKDIKIVKKFLNDNHVQGWVRSSLKLGLYHNGELVSVMLFDHNEGRDKMSSDEWNLSRFCNKLGTNVVGGASKLLKNFIKEYSVTRIISYADKDWSSGNLYEKLGFELVKDNNPDYKYIVDNKRIHKSRFKKANLNTELSEANFMKKHDIPKLWDCGKLKYEILI